MSASIFTSQHDTREAWLWQAVENFWRQRIDGMILMDGTIVQLPEKLHLSVGFSYGAKQENKHTRAVCWKRCASEDEVNHIFISPALDDPAQVLLTLGHECIHAALDCADGHKGKFVEIATRLGFTGSMTSSRANEELGMELLVLAAELGDYPHGKFLVDVPEDASATPRVLVGSGGSYRVGRMSTGAAPQVSRQLKLICPVHTTYICRASKATAAVPPLCGHCAQDGVLTPMQLT